MSALLVLAFLAGAPTRAASGPEQLVSEAENALWDDHLDVRDPCFILARDGIPPEELVRELQSVSRSGAESEALRARARLLLARLAPEGRSLCRSGEGREAPPPAWRKKTGGK